MQHENLAKVARELLETWKKEKLVLDWKKRQATRAGVRNTVEIVLDRLPRVHTPQIYEQSVSRCTSISLTPMPGRRAVFMRIDRDPNFEKAELTPQPSSSTDPFEQIAGLHSQGPRNLHDVYQAQIALATLAGLVSANTFKKVSRPYFQSSRQFLYVVEAIACH